jgi:crotonobetaine/carnitine-CoA ligase
MREREFVLTRGPGREECVLREVLERRAAEAPDAVFAVFEDGTEWTHGELLDLTRATAAGLQGLGVEQGDSVVVWLPNGPDVVRFWFAVNYLGAVYVPINTAYRGNVLAHVVENSGACLAIADGRLVERLGECESLGALSVVARVGDGPAALPRVDVIDTDALLDPGAEPTPPPRPIEPWDTMAILYTSGTTGPSKGVLTSYVQTHEMFASDTMKGIFGAEDRFMVNMPMFHVGGASILFAMLIHGGSVAVVDRFRTDEFWPRIRATGCTMVFLLGVMASFVERLPPAPDDADNPLRKMFMVPLVDDLEGFRRRFDVDVVSIYNMTELSAPIVSEWNPTVAGSCGRARPGIDVRLVDPHDREVEIGEVGEITIRTDIPWALNHGYNRNPEATAAAWRNGWFHTGDGARRDADGNYFFVDRLKDTIRRRGENISSVEVEAEILAHPAVREVAAVAARAELVEDEVLAVIAPIPGADLDPAELIEFLRPRCAHHMIPRYVRVVDELPKTPTAKVKKAELREAGVTSDTWDREAAGVVVRGERLR